MKHHARNLALYCVRFEGWRASYEVEACSPTEAAQAARLLWEGDNFDVPNGRLRLAHLRRAWGARWRNVSPAARQAAQGAL